MKKKLKRILKEGKDLYRDYHDQFWRAKKQYIKYYEELPIDEHTILIEASHGKNINGNMFYIAKYLCTNEKFKDYKIYFCAMGRHRARFSKMFIAYGAENIKVVMLASDEYFRLLASAKYLINDTTFGPYFLKKEGQIYLNTWHGTPLKALGRSIQNEPHEISNVQNNFTKADYILFPNEYTKDIIIRDYMLENISSGSYIMSGYPRNEVFLYDRDIGEIRDKLNLTEKRVYVYMPTFRGKVNNGGTSKNAHYLNYYLFELDRQLQEDEILYVNLHPLATKDVDFRNFSHIKAFPGNYETYDFLSVADVLITDYSSVFFDYAISRKKEVLFVYDKEEYLKDRGMYMSIDKLPFPQVFTVEDLLTELRSPKNYDDSEFLQKYCGYDCANASEKLCDYVILGKDTGLEVQKIPNNGKENVLIYAGNLSQNGITASLRNLLNCLDLDQRNYYFAFYTRRVSKHVKSIFTFPEKVNFWGMTGDSNVTIRDIFIRKAFSEKLISAKTYMKLQRHRVRQDLDRVLGGARFDKLIQFNGYETDVILMFSTFTGTNTIFVHNDMVQEIKSKGNQRWDVLQYAYTNYDHVAVVTEDMIPPTTEISGTRENIMIVKNAIDYRSFLQKGEKEICFDPSTKCTVPFERLMEILASDCECFINVGRFAPEKGHDRLVDAFARYHGSYPDSRLIILGGYSIANGYQKLNQKVRNLELDEYVILIEGVSNPYPIIRACDYFIFSSFYEGLGLVLVEANVLSLPVVSTDIPGPRKFMQEHGGTLVEDSEDGIYQGLELLHSGVVKPMNVDYEAYNREVIAEFEKILTP